MKKVDILTQNPTRKKARYCCDLHETDDEFDFIMKYQAYTVHEELLCYINDVYGTNNCSDRDFIHIMGAKDYDTLKVISNYIISALEIHNLYV